jgi:hypothetical protein
MGMDGFKDCVNLASTSKSMYSIEVHSILAMNQGTGSSR